MNTAIKFLKMWEQTLTERDIHIMIQAYQKSVIESGCPQDKVEQATLEAIKSHMKLYATVQAAIDKKNKERNT